MFAVSDYQGWLSGIGFFLQKDNDYGPATKDAVARFQAGFNPSPDNTMGLRPLEVDGLIGPQTDVAIRWSAYCGGLCSEHFRFREFACSHCGLVNVKRELCAALEVYRAQLSPGGMAVVSGTRCKAHNAAIGGAANSQHLYGGACDVVQIALPNTVARLRQFSGIEVSSRQLVCHVDVRHAIGTNFTNSSVDDPSVFRWATTLQRTPGRDQVCCLS